LSYRNRPLHGLLDWRMGYDLLSVFRDGKYRCGLDGGFAAPSLASWPADALQLRNRICNAFPTQLVPVDDFLIPAFRDARQPTLYLVSHPLWSPVTAAGSILALARSAASREYSQVRLVNTFDLARRMAWCWQNRNRLPIVLADSDSSGPTGGLSISVPCRAVPPSFEFTLSAAPRGTPVRRRPSFRRVASGDDISVARQYRVRHQSGEYFVARVSLQTTIAGGTTCRVQPLNPWDGVPPFTANRNDIVAELDSDLTPWPE